MMKHCFQQIGITLFTLALLSIYSVSFAQDEIIGKWKFDEGSGDTIYDASGNEHHGVIIDASSWVNGVSGSALRFDGIDDYAVVYHDGSLTGMEELTIEVWVKLDAEIIGENKCIINAWGPKSWEDDAYGVGFLNSDPHWAASVSGIFTGVQDLSNLSNTALNIGFWYHLVMVYSGDSLKLFTNGDLSFSDASMGGPIKATTRELMIGWMDYDINSNFQGDIDEITIYNYSLSPDTIKAHFKELNPYGSHIIGRWTFNEGIGDTVYDISGNGNHCAIIDASWISGISGNALHFDGLDDYAVVNHDGLLAGMERLTVEVWVRLKAEVTGENKNILNMWGPGGWEDDAYGIGFVNSEPCWAASISGRNYGVNDINNFSNTALELDKWYHLTMVFSIDSLKLYTNGELSFSDASMGIPVKPTTRVLMLGFMDYDQYSHFNGDIDEITIYDAALSPDTIKAHFEALDPYTTKQIIGHWTFNEGSGDSAFDLSGNGNHFKLVNGVTWVDSRNGKALQFDGIDDQGLCADRPVQTGMTALSIESVIWIEHHTETQWGPVIGKWGPGSTEDDAWALDVHRYSPYGGHGVVVGSTTQHIDGKTPVPIQKWIHLVFTWDGTKMKLYQNGKRVDSTDVPTIGQIQDVNTEIRLGHNADPHFFNGKIDQITLYKCALHPDTILAHYLDLVGPSHEINIGMKRHYAKAGEEIWIPIYIANFEDTISISSIEFSLNFDSSVITFLDVSKDSGIASNWQLYNNALDDSVAFSMGGIGQAIDYGEGELIRCKFKVKTSVPNGSFSDLVPSDVLIDEGNNVYPTTTIGKVIIDDISVMYGDVSGNNEVTAFDAAGIIKYVVGVLTIPDPNYPNFTIRVADVSGDGNITSFDAALVFLYSIGLIHKFPVETIKEKDREIVIVDGFPDATLRLIKSTLSTANTVYYDLIGFGIRSGISSDIKIKYDPAKIFIEQGGNITTKEYLNLESSVDKVNKEIRLSITTADDFDSNQELKLATIEAPVPDTISLEGALLFISALINEQKITNLDPFVPISISSNPNSNTGSVVIINKLGLVINNFEKVPLTVTIYDIRGRRVLYNKFSATNDLVRINTSKLAPGFYVYQVKMGLKIINSHYLKIKY